jgi:hypothetical protein
MYSEFGCSFTILFRPHTGRDGTSVTWPPGILTSGWLEDLCRRRQVEVGGGITHSVPIFEGFALPHATCRLEIAGQDLTEVLKHKLEEKGQVVSVRWDRR